MFERRHERLASPQVYRKRLMASGIVGLAMVAVSMIVGTAGYMFFEGLHFADAFVNACMILSGMGPLYNEFHTTGGKVFAAFYALYSGFAVLVIAAIMFAPVVHRVMHRFHIEEEEEEDKPAAKKAPPRKR